MFPPEVMPPRRAALVLPGLALGSLLSVTATARAQDDVSYAGTWRASTLRVSIEVESWGRNCNRRPPAKSTEPGGNVQITEVGDHLKIGGAVEGRTDRCWTPNHAVDRISARSTESNWRTVCRTPESDARAEQGTYSFEAKGPDEIVFRERSEYDWELSGSRCHAVRTATRTFSRVGTAEPAGEPDEPEEPSRDCDPGEPAKLRLRPKQGQIQPGEKLCFRARVLDASRCPVRTSVKLTVDRPEGLRGEIRGRCFHAADTAAEAEGEFRVTAKAGDLAAAATVVVRTADLSDLIARRNPQTEDGGVAEAVDPEAEQVSRVAARTEPSGGGGWGWPLAAAAAGLALVVGVATIAMRRRGARNRGRGGPSSSDAPEAGASAASVDAGAAESAGTPVASAEPPGPLLLACTVCGRELDDGTLYCPSDGTKLVDARDEKASQGQGMICPECRRGYPPDARFCPHDSEELMPYAMFAARQKTGGGSAQGKICPECGGRYEPDVRFCGKDGAELVLVN